MPVGQDRRQRGTSVGRGNNHGRAGGAIAAALFAWVTLVAPHAVAQEGNPLVQRNVPAEATAENAVVARDRALAAGQRVAYERMAAQLGLPTNVSERQVEAAVTSLIIESERITPRGYSARITVNFRQPGAAAAAAPAPPPVPGVAPGTAQPGSPAIATLDTTAIYRSFPEYVEITRRLAGAPAIARVEVLSVAGDMARLRLALRSLPPMAATELSNAGLLLAPMQGAPPGEGWRLGLAGGR